MSYDICLFDLDGTLTDPKEGITKSVQFALSSFGIGEDLSNLTKFIGPPLRESFHNFYGLDGEEGEKAVAKYREYFTRFGIFENSVYPDIPKLLADLKKRDKTLALATSKPTLYACQILEHFRLDRYFSYISGDEMDGSRTKNGKKEIIQSALTNIYVKNNMSIVMIGDRKHDVLGAKDALIDGIGITWGYGSKEELSLAGAVKIADTASQLYDMII